eukprot:761950-Prorocentrum_minimum.AAC.1
MVLVRLRLINELLRAADEVVPPQRREEEGEPPPRRAASKCARARRLYTPGAPNGGHTTPRT